MKHSAVQHSVRIAGPGLVFLTVSALLASLLFSSCAEGGETAGPRAGDGETASGETVPVLELSIADDLEGLWKQLAPPPFRVVRMAEGESRKKVIGTLTLERVRPGGSGAEGSDDREIAGADPAQVQVKTISRSYYAPTVPLWDERHEISSSALDGWPSDFVRPLHEIEPPMKALAVDGMTVEDTGYPLVEEVHLTLRLSPELPADGAECEDLMKWFDSSIPAGAKSAEVGWIGGVGDMMVARGIQDILIAREEGLSYIFDDTLPVLRGQDLLIGNLEGAVTTSGRRVEKSYNFRFRPEVLPRIGEAGFDYLSITNNHCYDYGEEGFIDTLENLEKYDIPTSGAGRTVDEAHEAAALEIPYGGREAGQEAGQETGQKAARVQVLSVAAYPRENNGFDGRTQARVSDTRAGIIFSGPEVLERIEAFSTEESIDVVAVHGGEEWKSYPTEEQRRFYRACVDAGAELVLGSHPHVLQGMEGYGGGIIAYSLGNFLFPGMYVMEHAEESLILSVGFVEGRPLYVRPYPVRIDNRRISLDDTGGILERFLQLTKQLHDS